MSPTISIVVVDDHLLFREELTQTLNAEPDVQVVGEGASAADAVLLVDHHRPDIVLLDLALPGGGISAAAQIVQAQPTTRIVILTGINEAEAIEAAQQLGTHCYLLKGISGHALTHILREVYHGRTSAAYWPPPDAPRACPRGAQRTW